jgi:hypothetical protein
MAIYPLLKNSAFGPEEIKVLTTAYEDALRTLRLADRADPATEIIAKKIIEFASAASAIRSDCESVRLNRCRDRRLGVAARPVEEDEDQPDEPAVVREPDEN